jgi:hypothetical protein
LNSEKPFLLRDERVDAFRTHAEIAFRQKAREYFVRECESTPSGIPPAPARVWRDLLTAPDQDGAPGKAGCSGVSEEVLVVDEASCRNPRLGLELIRRRTAADARGPQDEKLLRLAGMAGAAFHVFDAGTRAARARGFFSSSLMGFRDVQERLAGLYTGAELLRLGTIRACRLAGRGDPERAGPELASLLEKGRSLVHEARSFALDLLGEDWTRDHLPEDEPPPANERTQP